MKNKKSNGLSGKHVTLILGCVAIISAAVVAVIVLTSDSSDQSIAALPMAVAPIGAGIVTEENLADLSQQLRESIDRGMFATFMNTTWTFPDGYSPSLDAVKGNSASNNFPFWFTLFVPAVDEVVFTSGLIPVGSQMSEIRLDTPLPQGRYDAIININMIDDDGVPVDSNVGLGITLIVRN